jgi:L-iditol 2-dehydrogenase
MDSMKAVVKEGRAACVRRVPRPGVGTGEVLVRVAVAGLCRTDVYVAEGRLPARDPVVLGHEFAGVVEEVGPGVQGLARGARVTAMPVIPCGSCAPCAAGRDTTCLARTMLGVDRDGAFAEFVAVPAKVVYPVPDSLPFRAAAYAEPVAAALALLHSGIRPGQRGLIHGRNRFALLAARVLKVHGFTDVTVHDPAGGPPEANAYDFVVETTATTRVLAEVVRAVRPFGTVILKSRPARPPGLDVLSAVQKELTFRAVHYGPFAKAVDLLAEGRLDVADLLGPVHHLEDFPRVLAGAGKDESAKVFFSPAGDHVWHR